MLKADFRAGLIGSWPCIDYKEPKHTNYWKSLYIETGLSGTLEASDDKAVSIFVFLLERYLKSFVALIRLRIL